MNETIYKNSTNIIRFVIPVVLNKLIKVECMCLSDTTVFCIVCTVIRVECMFLSNTTYFI